MPYSIEKTCINNLNVPKAGADETKKKKRAPAKEKKAKGGKGKKKSAAGNAEANKENVEGGEGGEGGEGEVKEGGEGGGEVKAEKKKAVKKSIPGWATLSEETKKRLVHSKVYNTNAPIFPCSPTHILLAIPYPPTGATHINTY
jgi:hypothetical protein